MRQSDHALRLQRLVDDRLEKKAATEARLLQLDNEIIHLQSQLRQAQEESLQQEESEDDNFYSFSDDSDALYYID